MTETEPLMAGKRGLIMGVANERSIAWGIASAVSAQGAELAFTYQGEALAKRVRPLAESVGSDIVLPCDVADDASIDAVFEEIEARWGGLDFLVHAIAYSDKEELKGKYVDTSRGNFVKSLDISCYSFTAVSARAVPLMNQGGSLLTLTYCGAERVMPHYNVMGVAKAALECAGRYLAAELGAKKIRVNCISAGPLRTLSSMAVGGIDDMFNWTEQKAPLRRNIDAGEVGATAVYLLSDLSSAVTGTTLYVDAGYNIMG